MTKERKDKTSRQWYPRYPGDYGRKTAHLSLMQHGAYALLMDWYYANGKPLPLEWVQMHRICKAVAPSEQDAVQSVVMEFFKQTADGWRSERADEELVKKEKISDVRRLAQEARERNRAKQGAKGGANAHQMHTQPQPQPQEEDISIGDDAGIDANGRPTRGEAIEFPDWMMENQDLLVAFAEFMKFRQAIKRPIKTAYAAARNIGTLKRLVDEGNDPVAVVNQSIEKGWQGFFPVKADSQGAAPKKSFGRKMQDATVAAVQRYEGGGQ